MVTQCVCRAVEPQQLSTKNKSLHQLSKCSLCVCGGGESNHCPSDLSHHPCTPEPHPPSTKDPVQLPSQPLCTPPLASLQGLQDASGLSVTHPTWQRTPQRTGPVTMHHGSIFLRQVTAPPPPSPLPAASTGSPRRHRSVSDPPNVAAHQARQGG